MIGPMTSSSLRKEELALEVTDVCMQFDDEEEAMPKRNETFIFRSLE
jgi:hypothetical protein